MKEDEGGEEQDKSKSEKTDKKEKMERDRRVRFIPSGIWAGTLGCMHCKLRTVGTMPIWAGRGPCPFCLCVATGAICTLFWLIVKIDEEVSIVEGKKIERGRSVVFLFSFFQSFS